MTLQRHTLTTALSAWFAAFVATVLLAPAVPAASPAQDQPAQDEPAQAMNVETALWSNTVVWRTSPSTPVRVEMRDGDTVVGRSPLRVSDDAGRVELPLRPAPGAGGPGGGPGGFRGQPVGVRPGLDLILMPQDGEEAKVTVPDMAVGIDIERDRVVGRAPANAQLALRVTEGPQITGELTQTLQAGADGAFETDVAGMLDAQPGHAGGVTLTDEHGNIFHAFFAALTVELTIGARNLTGVATPGDTVALALTAPDGAAKGSSSSQLVGEYSYDLPQGFQARRQFGPIAVGDMISVTQTSTLPGASRTVEGVVTEVTIDDVSRQDRLVVGRAGPGAHVTVEAFSPLDGAVFRAQATADDTGQYVAELEDGADVGPGWRLRATAEIAPGMFVRAVESIEQVRVGVHQQVVVGVGDPGSTITVTLRAPDGTLKDEDTDSVNNNGSYGVSFGGDDGLQVGDRVEVSFVAGDPVIVNVEPISARTDWMADLIRGEAPNGAEVILTQGGGDDQARVSAAVKVDGTYEASFGGVRDLEPPMNGQMVARLISGHELFTTWAAVRMSMEVGGAFLSGNGPPNRQARAELVDRDGTTVVADGQDGVGGGGGGGGFGPGGGFGGGGGSNWFFTFTDDAGDPVDIRSFDIVRATVGDDVFEITVPELRGVAFVADDLVNGLTTGARDVTVSVFRPLLSNSAEMTVQSSEDGSFSADFAVEMDIQYNDILNLRVREEGHNVSSQRFVPGLRLNLDSGTLNGSWLPDEQVQVELNDGAGVRRFMTLTTTDDDAIFNVTFEDDAGRRLLPAEGDLVRVRPIGAQETLELVVPPLQVQLDDDADTVSGQAQPGGHLGLFLGNLYQRGPQGGGPGGGGLFANFEPEIAGDGRWTADLGEYDVMPGTRVNAIYRVPVGHLVFMQRFEAMLNAQVGGANACGVVGEPSAAVMAELRDGAAVVGEADGSADFGSQFSLRLRHEGEEVVSAPGQTVHAALGDESAQITLPEMAVTVNWQSGQLQGTGPAGAIGTIKWPAGDCLNPFGPTRFFRVNGEGQFNSFIQGGLRQPGDGFEIAFFTEDGHRVYRPIFRSLAQVYVHDDHVVGRAEAGQPVAITVVDGSGTEIASATTVANTDGRFGAHVTNGAGAEVRIEPGHIVRVEAGGETVEVPVEELSFDWSPGTSVAGQSVAGREVEIVMQLAGGRIVDVERIADDRGRFSYGPSDVPPRATWSLEDIVGVRLVVTLDSGHQLLSEAGDVSSIPLDPPTDVEEPDEPRPIYLPMARRGA